MIPELHTSRLVLRPFRTSDRDAFARFAGDAAYRRYLGPDHPDVDTFMANNLGADSERDPSWVVCRADDGEVIGSVHIGVTDGATAELACLLAPHVWRQGFAVEAARAVIDYTFSSSAVERVWAHADTANVGSVRGMKRLGMVCESRTGDDARYAVSRADWMS